jgi:hypothetical protein
VKPARNCEPLGKGGVLGENQRTGGKPVRSCLEKAANRLEKAVCWGKTSEEPYANGRNRGKTGELG